MKKILLLAMIVSIAVATVKGAESKAYECVPRNGLPNFFKKCEEGKAIKVAYLGGSITAQKGWRIKSLEYFKKLYPNVDFKEIDAAIGGTGSNFGVYRLEKDVLRYKPDLLFVEFATNDGKRKDTKYIEGIVRNTWKASPDCDICFVYTVAGSKAQKALENGNLFIAAAAHEKVAEHYGIPSIHMGLKAAELAKEGKLEWKAPHAKVDQVAGEELNKSSGISVKPGEKIPFSKDGVHPYLDTGHELYNEAIKRSVPSIKAAKKDSTPHMKLPEAINKNYIKNVSYVEASEAKLDGHWEKIDDPKKFFKLRYAKGIIPVLWQAKPGASMSFDFTGSSVLLYTISGPGSGMVEVTIDGKKMKHRIFDAWSASWRLNPRFICKGLDPEKTHSLTLKVLSEKFDKRAVFTKLKRERLYDKKGLDAFKETDFIIAGIGIEDGKIK
jgi:hypothetical protein